jgi:two-component system, cell cycle sensor histidine kinase PleC
MAASTAFLREEFTSPHTNAQRRRVAHDVRHTRDRVSLSMGSGRSVEWELLRSYAKNYLRTWPHHLLLTFALVSASTLWVPPGNAVLSFAVLAGLTAGTTWACHAFQKLDGSAAPLRSWRRAFVLAELAQGVGWVLAVWPFFDRAVVGALEGMSHSFVLVAVLLVMVSTSVLRAPILPAVMAGLAPLSAIIIVVAVHAGGVEEWALSLLTLSAQFFFLYFAHRLNRGAMATFRARAEMKASLAELERAKANSTEAWRRAEEADRAKAMFLATMSHELRTPLNAILGFSEVMKNEVLGSHSTPSYREYANDIHGSGQQLLTLINEILELARIESGHYTLVEEWVEMGDLVRSVVDEMKPYAEAKGHVVVPSIDAGLDAIRVDARAVQQIIGNLLSNALKFTPPGGRITVKAGWTSLGGQYVSVTDNGPGIPALEMPVVLSSFGRGSLAMSTAQQGAGLGLPIVKGLADLHGGRFLLRSGPREGTEAVVTFPAGRVGKADAEDAAEMPAPAQAA